MPEIWDPPSGVRHKMYVNMELATIAAEPGGPVHTRDLIHVIHMTYYKLAPLPTPSPKNAG